MRRNGLRGVWAVPVYRDDRDASGTFWDVSGPLAVPPRPGGVMIRDRRSSGRSLATVSPLPCCSSRATRPDAGERPSYRRPEGVTE